MLPGDRGPAAAFLGPALHLAGVGAGLDAQLILDAAGQSIRLWPDDEG